VCGTLPVGSRRAGPHALLTSRIAVKLLHVGARSRTRGPLRHSRRSLGTITRGRVGLRDPVAPPIDPGGIRVPLRARWRPERPESAPTRPDGPGRSRSGHIPFADVTCIVPELPDFSAWPDGSSKSRCGQTAATSNFVAARPPCTRTTWILRRPETLSHPCFAPLGSRCSSDQPLAAWETGCRTCQPGAGHWRSGADFAPDNPSPAEPPILIDLS
jgi:hypothetical protein